MVPDLPDGYYQVMSGNAKEGDRYWDFIDREFRALASRDVGIEVTEFTCLIRR